MESPSACKIGGYPLVNVYITMERSTIFHGKIHYFDWVIFNSYFDITRGYQVVPRDFTKSKDQIWVIFIDGNDGIGVDLMGY